MVARPPYPPALSHPPALSFILPILLQRLYKKKAWKENATLKKSCGTKTAKF
jgi:hypothetical protein